MIVLLAVGVSATYSVTGQFDSPIGDNPYEDANLQSLICMDCLWTGYCEMPTNNHAPAGYEQIPLPVLCDDLVQVSIGQYLAEGILGSGGDNSYIILEPVAFKIRNIAGDESNKLPPLKRERLEHIADEFSAYLEDFTTQPGNNIYTNNEENHAVYEVGCVNTMIDGQRYIECKKLLVNMMEMLGESIEIMSLTPDAFWMVQILEGFQETLGHKLAEFDELASSTFSVAEDCDAGVELISYPALQSGGGPPIETVIEVNLLGSAASAYVTVTTDGSSCDTYAADVYAVDNCVLLSEEVVARPPGEDCDDNCARVYKCIDAGMIGTTQNKVIAEAVVNDAECPGDVDTDPENNYDKIEWGTPFSASTGPTGGAVLEESDNSTILLPVLIGLIVLAGIFLLVALKKK